jgi:hypothetical protein
MAVGFLKQNLMESADYGTTSESCRTSLPAYIGKAASASLKLGPLLLGKEKLAG